MTSEQLEMLEYDSLLEYDDSEDTILEDLYGVKQEDICQSNQQM